MKTQRTLTSYELDTYNKLYSDLLFIQRERDHYRYNCSNDSIAVQIGKQNDFKIKIDKLNRDIDSLTNPD